MKRMILIFCCMLIMASGCSGDIKTPYDIDAGQVLDIELYYPTTMLEAEMKRVNGQEDVEYLIGLFNDIKILKNSSAKDTPVGSFEVLCKINYVDESWQVISVGRNYLFFSDTTYVIKEEFIGIDELWKMMDYDVEEIIVSEVPMLDKKVNDKNQ